MHKMMQLIVVILGSFIKRGPHRRAGSLHKRVIMTSSHIFNMYLRKSDSALVIKIHAVSVNLGLSMLCSIYNVLCDMRFIIHNYYTTSIQLLL